MSGLYSGLKGNVYSMADDEWIETIDAELNDIVLSNQQDAVVSIVMMPNAYINVTIDDDGSPIVAEATSQHTQRIEAPNNLGNYTPRNKKLLTYPYCFLCVDTLSATKTYRYEYFNDRNDIEFAEIGCVSPNPEIIVMPKYYNGSKAGSGTGSTVLNATESVICAGFPQCAFVIDSYRAWIAQKSVDYQLGQAQYLVRELGTVAGGIQSAMSGMDDVLPQGSSGFSGIGGSINAGSAFASQIFQQARETNAAHIEATAGSKVRGTCGSSSNVASRAMGIYYKYMCVTEQFAKMIDDFFDRFGYATGRIKVPNRNVRPHWTYTKTMDVAIRGNVPADDMRKIKAIYNNGITFWRNGSEVGNYSLDNRV